jgi:CRISPR/Cas system-associated endoribonuclease Cas2
VQAGGIEEDDRVNTTRSLTRRELHRVQRVK